jgi:hypothetical protein
MDREIEITCRIGKHQIFVSPVSTNGMPLFRLPFLAQEHGHIILLQADRPKASRGLVAGERHGLLDRVHFPFLLLGCRQIDRQILRVARSSLEKTSRFPRTREILLEIGESPGDHDVQASGRGRKV